MKKEQNNPSIFGSVMLAYFIVLLHIMIVACVGILIIFFRGVVSYLPLILLGGFSVLGASAYYLFRHFKSQGKSLREVLNSPLFRGKSVEISLMGGLASIKINSENGDTAKPAIETGNRPLLLEDPESERIRKLVDLARTLENDHINQKTAEKSKRNPFN